MSYRALRLARQRDRLYKVPKKYTDKHFAKFAKLSEEEKKVYYKEVSDREEESRHWCRVAGFQLAPNELPPCLEDIRVHVAKQQSKFARGLAYILGV